MLKALVHQTQPKMTAQLLILLTRPTWPPQPLSCQFCCPVPYLIAQKQVLNLNFFFFFSKALFALFAPFPCSHAALCFCNSTLAHVHVPVQAQRRQILTFNCGCHLVCQLRSNTPATRLPINHIARTGWCLGINGDKRARLKCRRLAWSAIR